jgi:5'-nucleotidase
MSRPLILVTNDDGIHSPGLLAALSVAKDLGEPLVVAPRDQQTSMSRAFPTGRDIGIIEKVDLKTKDAIYLGYALHGSPAQAAAHAVMELASHKPDLCISGINYGENLGRSLLISGTVGAALEASTYGIPSLAMSLEASIVMQQTSDYRPLDWSAAMHFTRYFSSLILNHGLPEGIGGLNVNVPASATSATAIRRTRQSMQDYFVFRKPTARDYSKPFQLNHDVKFDEQKVEIDSDIKACAIDRVVSVTLLDLNLTSNLEWGKPEWKI